MAWLEYFIIVSIVTSTILIVIAVSTTITIIRVLNADSMSKVKVFP